MSISSFVKIRKTMGALNLFLLFLGSVLGSLLALSWYIEIVNADLSVAPHMAPERFVVLSPLFAVPSFLVGLIAEHTVFRRFGGVRLRSGWLFLGLAYGSFWSCYGLVSVLGGPAQALLIGAALALGGALSVHVAALLLARRVGG